MKKAIIITIILLMLVSALPIALALNQENLKNEELSESSIDNKNQVGELQYFLDISVPAVKAKESNEYSPTTVWDMGYYGEGLNIAIMDSGVDDQIPTGHMSVDDMDDNELTYDPKFIAGGDGMSGAFISGINPEGTDEGHGTHCAGIALATGTTNAGVAPAARLIDMRVGAGPNLNINGVMNGLQWAIDNNETDWEDDGPQNDGVPIISMSFGGGTTNGQDDMAQLVNDVVEAGIVAVAAAGNGGQINTPSTADRAICVANIDDHNTIDRSDDTRNGASSSTGPRPDDGDNDPYDEMKPDISAPGTNIVAPVAHTKTLLAAATGTSMSTPHVAGIVALMLEANPDLKPKAPDYEYPIKRIMHDTAQDDANGRTDAPLLSEKWDAHHGWGYIDAYGCVKRAIDLRTGIASGPSEANSKQTVTFNARMNFTRTEYTIEDDLVKFKVFVPEEFEKPTNIKLSSTGGVGYVTGYSEPQKNNGNWEFEGWIRYTQDITDTRFCTPKITFDAVAPSENSDTDYDITVHFYQNDIRGNVDSHTITIKKATKPDLVITSITFTPNEPNEGEVVEIKATIKDNGGITSNTEVKFYDGNPDSGGKKIGTTQFVTVPAGGSRTASVIWDTTDNGGDHTIYVKIENTVPEEENINNNDDDKTINVNQPPNINVIIPNGGEIWEEMQDIHWNAVDPDGDDLSIDIFYSDNAGGSWSEIATDETNDGIYSWDTKTVTNGDEYLIKIKASDSYFTEEDKSDGIFEINNQEPGNNPPEVTVNSPNGEEEWEGSNDIIWDAEDKDGDNIKITIEFTSNNGKDWTKIIEDTSNDAIYSWDTDGLIDSDRYLIRVKANDGFTTTSDTSDSVFTVYNPIAPEVRNIFYPSNGEVVEDKIDIDWEARDENWDWEETDDLKISIDYWDDTSETWVNIIENYDNNPPSKYLWDTTQVPDGENYKIRVTATDDKGLSHSLESDGTFTIWNEDMLLDLISPKPGEEYSEEWPEIKWVASDRDDAELTIKIEYSDNAGNTWYLIADNIIDYYIFFMDSSNEDDLDHEVITKNIENAFDEAKYTLSPKAEVNKVSEGIWKITDQNKEFIIKKEAGDLNVYKPTTEYLFWDTGDLEDSDNYMIRITAYNDSLSKSKTVIMDDVFTIDKPDMPVIEILTPSTEGEEWSGITEIIWEASDADGEEILIDIWLYNLTTGYAQNLGLEENNDGSLLFDSTLYPDFDNYALIMYATDPGGEWAMAQSPKFEIDNPNTPEILVTSPNGGEEWSWEQEITWIATDDDGDNLAIEIYIIDDSDEIKIATTDNTGFYVWNTSNVEDGNNYKIKIIAIEQTEYELTAIDESNETFEIYNEGKYVFNLEILSDEYDLIGKAGDILQYEIMVTNVGEISDTFIIDISGLSSDWKIDLSADNLKNDKISLPGGLWQKIMVTVTIPDGEEAGKRYDIIISVTSEQTDKTENVTLFAEVERIYGVKIEIDIGLKEVNLGSQVIFNLTITNLGNARDTFTLKHSLLNEGWEAEFDDNNIGINAYDNKVVILTITSPEKVDNLTEEGNLELEITVTSSNDAKKSSVKINVNGIEINDGGGEEGFIPGFELVVLIVAIGIALLFVIINRRRY